MSHRNSFKVQDDLNCPYQGGTTRKTEQTIMSTSMFNTVLIANRGAIATRIIRTLKKSGIKSIAIYHQADASSLHVQHADIAINLGEGSVDETYLNIEKILTIAKAHQVDAIHPGYGFLSENTEFVRQCEQQGIAFIGPTPEQMTLFGLKHQAREAAEAANVPLVPGSPLLNDKQQALEWADQVGYPVMLKSTAGGGGIGMQVCESEHVLDDAWDKVKRLSSNYFANDGVFLEKYIAAARHIEVQIFGDGKGTAVSLGERDCSAQRRNQKVLEETPAPNLPETIRQKLHSTAERLMASVNYRNAGTVEFIYDTQAKDSDNPFYFLEVNTRLQVEHGVTEEVWGVDLVDWMVKQAAGELSDLTQLKTELSPTGHAVQARVYAEDPNLDFRPSAGLLSEVVWPEQTEGLRIDHWLESGTEVPPYFDPMLAKVICHKEDRARALEALDETLENASIYGIETNRTYLRSIIESDVCQSGELLTHTLASHSYQPNSFEVMNAGTQTTIQDYPARTGYWHIGVPPSGPMDNYSFRLANLLLGNDSSAAGLEITMNGPTLKFNHTTKAVVTGADIEILLTKSDGSEHNITNNQVIDLAAGDLLEIGKITGAGARSYLAVSDGIQCPDYLGSKSTFTLGQFGGHVGRALRIGDVLHLSGGESSEPIEISDHEALLPGITKNWVIKVIYGPHGAPEFFKPSDIQTFFDANWEVHYNSSRTGVRLIGPKPEWARTTGGEAGLHPSNIHDNAYAFGTIDFTGDMPVILGPDGPSLGGFVCPATVINSELWKLGQLKAGDKIRFQPVSIEEANALEAQQSQVFLANATEASNSDNALTFPEVQIDQLPSPIVETLSLMDDELVIRVAGDHFVLVELGPLELDIKRRFQVHALMTWLEDNKLVGIDELTPGIRSLQIHYQPLTLSLEALLNHLRKACDELTQQPSPKVSSRIVHLPLSWDDKACQQAIDKYVQSVRSNAPWCPSNLEFIRRINGLESLDQVKDIVFDASYLVMGLGDVYLGAPVATPLDPRHRLVTTKYNPARTWTAENSVGIGGAYMCIYGMEGPGGYQFVGRTLQMWNRYRSSEAFSQPWLLRFFDQIRFYPVSESELEQIRQDFPLGKYPIRIEETEFDLDQYQAFLDEESESISRFQNQRSSAFDQELEDWKEKGLLTYEQEEAESDEQDQDQIPEHLIGIDSPVSGSVWQVEVETGQQVNKGDRLMILESMKMEIEVFASKSGTVENLLKQQGQAVTAGQSLVWIKEN